MKQGKKERTAPPARLLFSREEKIFALNSKKLNVNWFKNYYWTLTRCILSAPAGLARVESLGSSHVSGLESVAQGHTYTHPHTWTHTCQGRGKRDKQLAESSKFGNIKQNRPTLIRKLLNSSSPCHHQLPLGRVPLTRNKILKPRQVSCEDFS